MPEVQADLAFHILEASSGLRSRQRLALVGLAWNAAASARDAVPLGASFRTTDSREAVALHYQKRRVDALSIRLTALRFLIAEDPAEALRRFADVLPTAPPPPSCADAVAPDFAQYYAVAAQLMARAFRPKDRVRGDDLAFTRRLAATVPGVLGLGPWLKFVGEVGLGPSHRQELINTAAVAALEGPVSDRALAIAESRDGLPAQLESVVTGSALAGSVLANLYRRLLERVLAGPICADSNTPPVQDDGLPAFDRRIAFYNRVLAPFASPPSPMKREELRPEVSRDGARLTQLPEVPFLNLLDNLRAQRHGLRALPPERRANANPDAWEVGALQFLHRLDGWRLPENAGAPERAAFFHQRASFYLYLIDSLPAGPLAARSIDRLVSLLENDGIKRESPVEWLGKVGALLTLARHVTPAERERLDQMTRQGKILGMLPRSDAETIRQRLRLSRDPELAAYAEIEQRFPVPFRLGG